MIFVTRFPKTRSHNYLRRTIKAIANAEEFEMPCNIVNPAVNRHIKEARDKWWENDPKLMWPEWADVTIEENVDKHNEGCCGDF